MPAVDFFLTEGVYKILRKGLFIHALLVSYLIIIKKTHDGNTDKQWRHHDNAKKVFVYELFCQLGKIFYQKKDNDSTSPLEDCPPKIMTNPNPKKTPITLTNGGILGGNLLGGNFPVTNNNISLLRMLIKKKANENSVSIETFQQKSLESTGKTELSLNYPTQKESGNFHNFH